MRLNVFKKIVFFTLPLLLATASAQGGSVFSVNSLGEMVFTADARLRGMGGVGLALTEGMSGSLVNPALLGGLKWAGITCSFRPEALYVKDEVEDNVLTTVRAHDFALYIPLGKRLAFAVDLRQVSDFHFQFYEETSIFDNAYTKSVIGTGGTSLASISVARTFGSSLYVGMRVGHLFGKTTKSWTGDFSDISYLDSRTTSEIEHAGTQASLGIAFKLSRQFSVGAILTPSQEVDQKEVRVSSFSPTTTKRRTLTYPKTIGLGLNYRPNPKFMTELDVTATTWSDFEIDGKPEPSFTDVIRVAAGCEFVARKKGSSAFLRRVPLRLGYALEPWYQKTAGDKKIYAHFVTIGFGLPLGQFGAYLDASLELGMRGDVPSAGAEEKIVRGTFSLWGFEPWFQRRK